MEGSLPDNVQCSVPQNVVYQVSFVFCNDVWNEFLMSSVYFYVEFLPVIFMTKTNCMISAVFFTYLGDIFLLITCVSMYLGSTCHFFVIIIMYVFS